MSNESGEQLHMHINKNENKTSDLDAVNSEIFFDSLEVLDSVNTGADMTYFDAKDTYLKESTLNLLEPRQHVVKVKLNNNGILCNAAPTVSKLAGLELLQLSELQVNTASHHLQPVIFDTGASLAITGQRSDFLPNTYQEVHSLKLGGMAAGAEISGVGEIAWTFGCNNGDQLSIVTKCYYVPSANTRLLSPQKLLDKRNGQSGKYWGDEDMFHLEYDQQPGIDIPYSLESNLPIGYAAVAVEDESNQINLTILDKENQNLTGGQKLLLEWHYRFGHTNMALVQQILKSEGFATNKFIAAAKCTAPKCAICEMAKGHRRSTKGQIQQTIPVRDGALKINDLRPGTTVSVDHFESRLKGRTFDSFGKATSDQYIGGCIFVDHASSYVHMEFQLGFSAIETIWAKQNFEKYAFNNGVIPLTYLTDSGAFKANKFVQHICEHNQKIQYCGTNAHHQNGVAERAIRTISNMARAMLLHASAHWKHGIDASMWPMAVQYATYTYNILPRRNGVSPNDLFFGSRVPRHKLRNLHVWGCPVYVLNPSLQAGKKIPRWEPRSKLGVFCGLSTLHSSEVPQVLNLTTGSITTQFHVIFDDLFTTVPSIEREDEPPSHWEDLCLEQTTLIPNETSSSLSHEWQSTEDVEQDLRTTQRSNRVRGDLESSVTAGNSHQEPLFLPNSQAPLDPESSVPTAPNLPERRNSMADGPQPQWLSSEGEPQSNPTSDNSNGLRRSARTTKGKFSSTRYINEV